MKGPQQFAKRPTTCVDGQHDGCTDGCKDGTLVGCAVGSALGWVVGRFDGWLMVSGNTVGREGKRHFVESGVERKCVSDSEESIVLQKETDWWI